MEKRGLRFQHHTLTNLIHDRWQAEKHMPNLQSFWEKKRRNSLGPRFRQKFHRHGAQSMTQKRKS